jgi:lipopolysaccharide transport system ATP-binding protein
MKPVIRVDNLTKEYRIGLRQKEGYGTFREALSSVVRAPFQRIRSRRPFLDKTVERKDAFFALKDVSFEVSPGEVVGIIGRNGAGKSTLLKILSRITEPTKGRLELRGRVGSLLEVGTGFHSELTGRENIYLNGSILGMSRREITRKFDEIVAFSEIEQFLDTPVKRYSSGMYVRLAFAVAAHLEPEILIVDEVLAVGDIAFQKKSMGKMQDVARHGRTVLFVSHNISAVTRLCNRALLLTEGHLDQDGPAHEIACAYLSLGRQETASHKWTNITKAPGNEVVRLLSVCIREEKGEIADYLDIRRPALVEMEYEVIQAGTEIVPNLHFFNQEGVYLFVAHDLDPHWRHKPRPVGRYLSTAHIPGNFFAEGRVVIGAAITTYSPFRVHLYEREIIGVHVVDSSDGDTARGDFVGHMPGVIRPILAWNTVVVTS